MLDLKDLLLREPALTLATAESMTCGRIQARIGAISGASKFFLGGITAYTIDQKVHHLGVDRALAESCNAVSSEIAEQMAIGACQLFGASLGVATTGYAENPVGRTHPFAWWALAHYLGDGLPKDPVEAYKWTFLSSGQLDGARALLAKLRQELSPAQVAEGERAARAWQSQSAQR